jgi:hypothetical protein
MDDAVRRLIAALHAAPLRYAVVLTGGGTTAAAWLLSVPGGSRTVLEVTVPYGERALTEYLGRRPESFCSAETSRALAARAFDRAAWLCPGEPVAGVACTASLRSDRPKRGDHRFHLTVQSFRRAVTHSLTLAKGARDREAEEDVLDRVLVNAVAELAGLAERVPVPLLPGEGVRAEEAPRDLTGRFLAGEVSVVCVLPDGRRTADAPRPLLLLPGSFNPLHHGHTRLAQVAAELAGLPAAFELTVVNADKPPLADAEVRRRAAQFAWKAPLWLTRAPTFTEKAALFPGATFVVGADTAARIVRPCFYHGSEDEMARALADFRGRGCRFLVAGRADAAGRFVGLETLDIPPSYRDLFRGIPESAFRADISSTQLRAAGA